MRRRIRRPPTRIRGERIASLLDEVNGCVYNVPNSPDAVYEYGDPSGARRI
jgi:hypothetical protein